MIKISLGGWSAKSSASNFSKCPGSKQNVAASVMNLPGTKQAISVQCGSYVFIMPLIELERYGHRLGEPLKNLQIIAIITKSSLIHNPFGRIASVKNEGMAL